MIALWLLGTLAWADVTTDPAPVLNEACAVRVTSPDGTPLSGETVRVVHRPGMAGETEVAIGITDTRGKVRWTPIQAGMSILRAGDQTRVLQVQRTERPKALYALLGLLIVASLGGLAYGLLGSPPAPRRS